MTLSYALILINSLSLSAIYKTNSPRVHLGFLPYPLATSVLYSFPLWISTQDDSILFKISWSYKNLPSFIFIVKVPLFLGFLFGNCSFDSVRNVVLSDFRKVLASPALVFPLTATDLFLFCLNTSAVFLGDSYYTLTASSTPFYSVFGLILAMRIFLSTSFNLYYAIFNNLSFSFNFNYISSYLFYNSFNLYSAFFISLFCLKYSSPSSSLNFAFYSSLSIGGSYNF